MALKPTEGHIIVGSKIDEYRFVGRVKARQLFQIAPDPRDTENKKKLDASKSLQDLNSVREEVQRLFEGQKKKNVNAYAAYIVDLHNGTDGVTPPITLYTDSILSVDEAEDGTCSIQIPWGEQLVAIDGETQLAARHEAANIEPATGAEFVAIYLCHGKDLPWARQAFHDLNTLGIKVNAALSISMDARDQITAVSREVERRVPFFKGRVNKVRRQLKGSDLDVMTISVLRGACVTLAKGINGVQFGSRPVQIEAADMPLVTETAVEWFSVIAEKIGGAIEDRERKLAGAPAVLAALGAMGNQLLSIADVDERRQKARSLAAALTDVNWERARRWEGIAGKFTPKGSFSVGGPKETAYAIFSALTDANDPGFTAIRSMMRVAA